VNESVGIFAQQAVVGRLSGERDGVGLGFGAITPAIEDDENEWFRTGQIQLLALSSDQFEIFGHGFTPMNHCERDIFVERITFES
jgi:hypothetical protein